MDDHFQQVQICVIFLTCSSLVTLFRCVLVLLTKQWYAGRHLPYADKSQEFLLDLISSSHDGVDVGVVLSFDRVIVFREVNNRKS